MNRSSRIAVHITPQNTVPTTADRVWYFAYGSNMLFGQMRERINMKHFGIKAHAQGWRFDFNKRSMLRPGIAYSNIQRHENSMVWGVLYPCTSEQMRMLDQFEYVPQGSYVRTPLRVFTEKTVLHHAISYVAPSQWIGTSGQVESDYAAKVLAGATEHELPTAYITQIENMAKARGASWTWPRAIDPQSQ